MSWCDVNCWAFEGLYKDIDGTEVLNKYPEDILETFDYLEIFGIIFHMIFKMIPDDNENLNKSPE